MNLKTSLWLGALLVFGAALLFTLGVPKASAAVSWYVDANVAASGSGTAASPFKKISEAVTAASNGDTIHLQNGTYSPSTNGESANITVNKQLTLEGETQDGVIIDPELADPSAASYLFTVTADANFTQMTFTGYHTALVIMATNASVSLCTFEGYYDGAMRGNGGIITYAGGDYSFNTFHDNRGVAIQMASLANSTYSFTANSNEIVNDDTSPYTKTPMGIAYIGLAGTDSVEIKANTISGAAGAQNLIYGIYALHLANTTNRTAIEDNVITDSYTGIFGIATRGTNNYQWSNNIIEHGDTAYQPSYGTTYGISFLEVADSAGSGQIYNNLFDDLGYGLFIHMDPSGSSHYDDYLVTNNTFDRLDQSAVLAYSVSSGSGNLSKLTAQNNIVSRTTYGFQNGGPTHLPLHTFSSDYNDFYDISADSYTDVNAGDHDGQKDPEFSDKNNGDYTLSPSSLLIDAGTAALAPTDDLDGYARPTGRGFDIGAYESIDWSGMFRIGNGYIATAPAAQGGSQYKFFKYDGAQVYKAINAFNTDWRSEFKVQTADINDDGIDEIVAYAGAGVEPKLRVYKKNGDRLAEVTALSPDFRGGLSAATGDFNNDGKIEIAVAPAASGGPQVQVYKYDKGKLILMTQFLAYPGTFRGGLTLAAGDTDANGYSSIITAPSSGGGPDVQVYRYKKGKFNKKAAILAYGSGNRDGVNLTSTDLNRDGKDEIVTAPMNGKSNVRVYREEDGKLTLLDWKMVFGNTFAGGVNLSSGDVNADRKGEIVLTPAHGGGPNLMIYQLNEEDKLVKVTSKTVYAPIMRAGYKTAVGDLNDDGTSEIAIVPTAPQTANIQVFTMLSGKLQKVKSFMAYAGDFRGGVNLAIGGR